MPVITWLKPGANEIIRNPKPETRNFIYERLDWISDYWFLVLCGLFGLWQISKPYEVSTEEFEKRAAESPSLLSAGFVGLQKILDPAAKKAIAAQEDFEEGRFDAEQAKGDGDEAGQTAVSSKQ